MSLKPLVFVAMPFGIKKGDRISINFDSIYNNAIKKAIEESPIDLDIMRADEEKMFGFIHGPMYERLLLSEIVIADLTLANPNVFYELGIRHCARPRSTILIFSDDTRLPFDVSPLRALSYKLTNGKLDSDSAESLIESLKERIDEALKETQPDSPLFQLIKNFPGISLKHEESDSFRTRLFYIESLNERLDKIKSKPKGEALKSLYEIEEEVGDFNIVSYEILIKLLLTYRDIEAWDDMIRIIDLYPSAIRNEIKIKEQLALALNRRNKNGDRNSAIRILSEIINNYGPSSETLGILGRVYKDKYYEAKQKGDNRAAKGALKEAIATYYKGFEEDPRDYYPGINALTLMLVEGSENYKKDFNKLKPLVGFAIERQGGKDSTDYWVLATTLEFACLTQDWDLADQVTDKLCTMDNSTMQIKTTVNNLCFILEQFKSQKLDTNVLESIIKDMNKLKEKDAN